MIVVYHTYTKPVGLKFINHHSLQSPFSSYGVESQRYSQIFETEYGMKNVVIIKLSVKQKLQRFYHGHNRLTMGANSIEAPESPIFSHGQTSINTSTKNNPTCARQTIGQRIFFRTNPGAEVRLRTSIIL